MTSKRTHAQTIAPSDYGISLIEMLVVLAIISIVLASTVPTFRQPNDGSRPRLLAAEIAAQMRAVRAMAVARNNERAFVLNAGERTYVFEGQPNASKIPLGINMTLITSRQHVRTIDEARLVFFPDGTSTGGRLLISQRQQNLVVTVDWLTGSVTIGDTPPR